jgi:hypothetical protein
MSEFSRIIDTRHLPGTAQKLTATAAECAALAARFHLVAVRGLEAEISLRPDGRVVRAEGRFVADIVQACAVSGEDLPARLAEPIALRFVPEGVDLAPDEEIELTSDQCDEIEMTGSQIDLGEAVAQSLALAIDPYATGPGAAEARQRAGLLGNGEGDPFAALAALKKNP